MLSAGQRIKPVVKELGREGHSIASVSNFAGNVVSLSLSMALEEIGAVLAHNGVDSDHSLCMVDFKTTYSSP